MDQIYVNVVYRWNNCVLYVVNIIKTNCLFHQNKIAGGGRIELIIKLLFRTFYTWISEFVWVSMCNYNQGQITTNSSKKQG